MGQLENLIFAIEAHNRANPTHGFNCICMDEHIRALRITMESLGQDTRQRAEYIMSTAAATSASFHRRASVRGTGS